MNYLIFVILLAALVGLNYAFRFDVDERQKGEPLRDWKAKATYHKSLFHGLGGYALTATGLLLGLNPFIVVPLVFGALLVFEFSQGFLDWFDVLANSIGIIAAIIVLYVAGRL